MSRRQASRPLSFSLCCATVRSGRNNAWFKTIVKPSIFPPGIVFPIAWTAIYIGMGSALALVLAEPPSSAPHRSLSLGLFGAQLVLNYSWSPIFFKMHRMKLALAATGGMIVTTVPAAVLFWNIKPTAGLLLAPYLAWLAFAFALNYRFIQCNPQSNGNGSSKKLKGRTQE